MSSTLVALCYGSAMLLALALLWHFGAKSWYWHTLSIAVAFAVGIVPMPQQLNTPEGTLCVGWVFIFLAVWGIAAPAFAWLEHHPELYHRSR